MTHQTETLEYESEQVTTRESVLTEAIILTTGDRNKQYGDPKPNMQDIAKGWEVIFGVKIEPHEVALAMDWVKICRIKTSPSKRDNWVDIAGYAAVGAECVDVE